jgi:hypothetical protein
METEAEDGGALMLFLRHYLSLAKEGVDASELYHLQEQLGKLNNLTAEDFSVVTEWWQESGNVPTVAQFLESLSRESALKPRQRTH